nr:immunoglobulin light chain junction region [Macaca mulatta]MOV36980.1 immunoglobulin light chain junction region [Macaca mulatta]MOV36989.1 immunoglobulin light chain junction region [Macaca mulatta]MOV37008.1 immunoglobulin light chain junction region [Macaca mulatta]MOV37012.1 immunoglobulin light chain junction region [Macaca mulatta]
CLQRNYYPFTF